MFTVVEVIEDAAAAAPLIAGQATLVPGFMPLADAWPVLMSTGVRVALDPFTVHHFPELGWGRRRFIAVAELEAVIAAERAA